MSLCELMAVAVTMVPAAVAKSGIAALPFESVVTEVDPRNVCPSPFADGSHELLPKNCTVKVLTGMLLSVPVAPARHRGQHREVLEVVGAGVGIGEVVRRHAGDTEIDAQVRIAEDRIAHDCVAGPRIDADANHAVVRDDVGGAGRGSTDRRPIPVQGHAVPAVRAVMRSRRRRCRCGCPVSPSTRSRRRQ